jgi:spore coat polysaccharide biosynthesis predicted glycosyltransferase SpsG
VGFDWCQSFVPDINFVVFPHTRKIYPSKIETYIGFEYLILDKRFTSNRKETSVPVDKYQLISIGFSANSNRILEVLDAALKMSNLPIKICSGVELDLIHNESVQLLRNPDDYVRLVQDSEIIYTNGASTLLEAILLRKKIVAFPQTIDEEFFLAEVENRLGVAFTPSKGIENFLEYDPTRIFDTKGELRILEALGRHLS